MVNKSKRRGGEGKEYFFFNDFFWIFFYRNGSSGSAICAFTVETIKARFADKVFTSKDAVLTPLAVSKIPDGFVPGKVSMCT